MTVIDSINGILETWKYNMVLVNELYRLRKLRRAGFPGWDGRIQQIECIIYGGCPRVSLGQITSGSGFPGQDIAPQSVPPPVSPGQPPASITGGAAPDPMLSTNQVKISDSPTLISAQNTTRDGIIIKNLGTVTVYIGPYNVSTSTGYPLAQNEAATFPTSAPIYGVITSGNPLQTVTYVETGKET